MTLKDSLFNKDTVTMLANQIMSVYSKFDQDTFINDSIKTFKPLELKERMSSVREKLEKHLPNDYIQSIEILSEAMTKSKNSYFVYGAILEYVEKNGCNDKYVELSLEKLGEYTKYFSAEFAIRPFLSKYPVKSLKIVEEWSKSTDYHQRRLASEGTRPSLPWAPNITVEFKQAAKSLDNLYYDKERYVTRSVANHLNDISKIDPDYVLNKLTTWKNTNKQVDKEMKYMINHSLRTLIKKGHPGTLEFLGYNLDPKITVSEIEFTNNEIKIGEKLKFSFLINAYENTKLMVDYTVYYPSKSKRRNQKTYKLKVIEAQKDKEYLIKGTRSFKEISTRKLRPGLHEIEVQVNGKVYINKEFNVIE